MYSSCCHSHSRWVSWYMHISATSCSPLCQLYCTFRVTIIPWMASSPLTNLMLTSANLTTEWWERLSGDDWWCTNTMQWSSACSPLGTNSTQNHVNLYCWCFPLYSISCVIAAYFEEWKYLGEVHCSAYSKMNMLQWGGKWWGLVSAKSDS